METSLETQAEPQQLQPDPWLHQKRERRRKSMARRLIGAVAWAGPKVGRIGPLRRTLVDSWERKLREGAEADLRTLRRPPGVVRDRLEMGISILKTIERGVARGQLSRASVDRMLKVLIGESLVDHGIPAAKERFKAQFGVRPPGFLLISPTKACNLRCTGCYADSGPTREKLEWPIIQRLVRETHDLWGGVFVVLSGGEPLIYRDQGKTMLDLAEENPDCFFMFYTNGTLIDDQTADRLGKLGNLMPAVSMEGMREETDRRRGSGVFDRVVAAMERLRRAKVFFGVSMTATRENADTLLSDEVIDYYFEERGALFGWVFQYMPIGRAYTLEFLPTPEQRLRMWKRSWQLVYERHLFLADFWNGGTASHGCISAGHPGGYMTVDWNGKVSPCVFVPYSPVDIHDAYSQGKTLVDIWAHPFFARLREWQEEYGNELGYSPGDRHGNWMMPCPIRDHYDEFFRILQEHHPDPVDENAREAMLDPEYRRGMTDYNRAVAELFDPIWNTRYMKGDD